MWQESRLLVAILWQQTQGWKLLLIYCSDRKGQGCGGVKMDKIMILHQSHLSPVDREKVDQRYRRMGVRVIHLVDSRRNLQRIYNCGEIFPKVIQEVFRDYSIREAQGYSGDELPRSVYLGI
jgi:hypothetical protein